MLQLAYSKVVETIFLLIPMVVHSRFILLDLIGGYFVLVMHCPYRLNNINIFSLEHLMFPKPFLQLLPQSFLHSVIAAWLTYVISPLGCTSCPVARACLISLIIMINAWGRISWKHGLSGHVIWVAKKILLAGRLLHGCNHFTGSTSKTYKFTTKPRSLMVDYL